MSATGTQLAPEQLAPNGNAKKPGAPRKAGRGEITVFTLALVAVIFWAGAFAAKTTNMWLIVLGALIVFVLFLGQWICGRPLGIFIAQRNLMSLSRFQMVLWTLLILSAYFTMCVHRVRDGNSNPLDIAMDWHLWALMGISTASLIGSPLLLGNKMQKDPHADEVQKMAQAESHLSGEDKGSHVGTLYANPRMQDASFADMFQGDEVGNTYSIDVAKVQMFFFTLISLMVYGAAVYHLLQGGDYHQMPVVSDGLVALLGISHGGYLTSKVTDHTQTAA